ncbi:hypothetical protein [Streptomyces sp. NPDC051001]|uniref:hypothetical protein n=1 Tax=Streptomyces sp. NPDC051001 TaxID=3155795 RepID=UPI00343E53CB
MRPLAARRAVTTDLEADDSAELLYRDLMRIEHAAGNRSGLHTTITPVQQINRTLDCDLETETEQLINDLLHGNGRGQRKALYRERMWLRSPGGPGEI